MLNVAFRLVLFLCLVLIPVTAQASYEDEAKKHPFYADIEKAVKALDTFDFILFLNKSVDEDISRLPPVSIWLRERSIKVKDAASVNSLYFLPYADISFLIAQSYKGTADTSDAYTALGKSAMMTLYTYEAMAMVDAVRCADASVLQTLAMNTLGEKLQSPAIIATYKDFEKADFDVFSEVALTVENKFAARPPNKDICSMGNDRMNDMVAQPGVTTTEIPDPDYPEGKRTEVIEPPGYHYEPKFLTDAEWQEKRAKIREELKNVWAERYAANSAKTAEPEKP